MANIRTAVQSRPMPNTRDELPEAAHEATRRNTARPPSSTRLLTQRLRRWLLGTAYALRPNRIALMPRLTLMSIAHLLAP